MDKRFRKHELGVADHLPVAQLDEYCRYHPRITEIQVVPKPLIAVLCNLALTAWIEIRNQLTPKIETIKPLRYF